MWVPLYIALILERDLLSIAGLIHGNENWSWPAEPSAASSSDPFSEYSLHGARPRLMLYNHSLVPSAFFSEGYLSGPTRNPLLVPQIMNQPQMVYTSSPPNVKSLILDCG